jgi:hypothetical protein
VSCAKLAAGDIAQPKQSSLARWPQVSTRS